MPLTYPSIDNLNSTAQAELRNQIPEIDPTIFGSFVRPLITSGAAAAYAVTLLVRDAVTQFFPQTATGSFLELLAGYENLERTPASAAQGNVTIDGALNTIIDAGQIFSSATAQTYEVTTAATVVTQSQAISSLTRVGNTVTATTTAEHTLATGASRTIAGAVETEYNGTFEITVTGRDTFTYSINTEPTTPATGAAITVSGTYAVLNVESTGTGQATNLSSGAIMTLTSPLTGITGTATVLFDGVTGGADIEQDTALRTRVLLSRSIIEGVFTEDQIKLAALGVAGNTRVFIKRPQMSVAATNPSPTDTPSPGQVFVFILRDNDANIIPSQTVLNNTKQAIIENGSLPANTAETDLFVFAPLTQTVDFTFSSITPDTPTMRSALRAQLRAFFEDKVNFEEDVTEASYQGDINNTQDLRTGTPLRSFQLSAPTGDITVSTGRIATLGEITFT